MSCGFHGPGGLVVSEAALRKAVVDAANAERKIWEKSGSLQLEHEIDRFPDLVRYWLAGMDSSIRPDWLQALQAATGSAPYGNLTNATLSKAIADFNTEDTNWENAKDAVYSKSGAEDAARDALEPLRAPAVRAVTKARDAKRVLASVEKAKPRKQAAVAAARQALAAAELERDVRVAARDAAAALLANASAELKQAREAVKTTKAARDGLEKAAKDWPELDRQKARDDLVKQSSAPAKKVEGPVDLALTAAHNSRADTEAWSAAFVGSVIRSAAIGLGIEAVNHGADGLLKASRNHWGYVLDAKRNARAGRYQAFEPAKRPVQIGDIICTDRAEFITRDRRQTLTGLQSETILHGDIVTSIELGVSGFAETVGGNVNQTVRKRRYPLNDEGKLVVKEDVLIDQEGGTGKFTKGGSLGAFATLATKPSMLDRRSSFRVFALLSPVELCKATPKKKDEMFSLESPFLDEDVAVDKARDEVAGRTVGVSLESPFLA